MLKHNDITNEFVYYVIEDMQEMYGVDANKANELLDNYNFLDMLMAEPDFVMHYNTEIWAERIYKKITLETV